MKAQVWQHKVWYNSQYDSLVIHEISVSEPGKDIQQLKPPRPETMVAFEGKKSLANISVQALFGEMNPSINSVIRFEYSLFTKGEAQPALMAHETIKQPYPVLDNQLIASVPKRENIQHQLIHAELKPKNKKKGNLRSQIWNFGTTSAYRSEKQAPVVDEKQVYWSVSSSDSLFPLFNEFTSQAAFTFETTQEMRDQINAIIQGKTSNIERIGAVHEWLMHRISPVNLPRELNGYLIRPAAETWSSGLGNHAEQAVLLTAAIRSLGWKATPIAAVPAKFLRKDSTIVFHGNLDLYPITLVKVPLEGRNYFLDPRKKIVFNEASSYPDHYMIPFEMGYSQVNASYQADEAVQFSWDGELDILSSGAIKGYLDGNYLGSINPYLGLKVDPGMANTLYPATGSTVELLRNNGSLVRFYVEEQLNELDSNTLKSAIPYGTGGIESWGLDLSAGSRQSAIALPGTLREIHRIIIKLPNNIKPVDFQIDHKVDNALGRVTIRHSYEGNRMEIMRHISLNQRIIQPDQYPDLLELASIWFEPDFRSLTFKKSN